MRFFFRCIACFEGFVSAGADGNEAVWLSRAAVRYVYLFRFLVVVRFSFRLGYLVVFGGPVLARDASGHDLEPRVAEIRVVVAD